MNAMKNNRWLAVALGAIAVSIVGCGDPYEKEPGGSPQIVRVFAQNGTGGTDAVEGVLANGVWTITVPAADEANVVYVQTNKLLDGKSIEAPPQSCTPVASTIAPALAAGESLMSCYYPSSASPDVGASIIFWVKPSADYDFTDPEGDLLFGAAPFASGTTITSTVKDKDGAELPISIQIVVTP